MLFNEPLAFSPRGQKPFFISFEGGEASGKTTQANILYSRLHGSGLRVTLVKEPGSTPLGQELRAILKGRSFTAASELLLFLAARAELVEKVLQPALVQSAIVIADRYADSTLAYQGYGRGLDLGLIQDLNSFVTRGIMPRLTFLLDLPPEEAQRRLAQSQAPLLGGPGEGWEARPGVGRLEAEGSRFEAEAMAFHQRVRDGYLKLAAAEPRRWRVLDGRVAKEVLADLVWGHVKEMLAAS
ncbi:MAG: dTMP kinase [Chloroflexi bacterium]|nr:dTMP kinase [Chloroflexota bacterium]